MEKNSRIDEDLSLFIVESREILEGIEPQLVKIGEGLDNNLKPDDETVNQIFRGFHTIKGTAAFYQLDSVVSLAHKAETLLEFFRNGSETLNASCTDVLCQTMDVMEHIFVLIESGEPEDDAQDKIRSVMYRLTGRIDAIRKKHDEPVTETVAFHEPEMISPDPCALDMTGEMVQPRIGKHVRICILESRIMMKRIMGLSFIEAPYGLSAYREDEIEICNDLFRIMGDSAGFLGFENLQALLGNALDWVQSRNKDMDVKSEDVEYFCDLCNRIFRILEMIERSGSDKNKDKISILLPDDVTDNSSQKVGTPFQDRTEELTALFLNESLAMVDRLEKSLLLLRDERLNRAVQRDILGFFHKLKGSAGIMGLEDMEALCERAEYILEEVLDELFFIDVWDVKALWAVACIIRQALVAMDKGEKEKPFDRAEVMGILHQITSGKTSEEKENDIKLPEMTIELSHEKKVRSERKQGNQQVVLDTGEAIPGGVERRKTDKRDIRVSIEKLDELINLVGELVIAENMVVKNPDVLGLELENFERASAHLRKIVKDLQEVALAVRMIPVSGVFRKMIRLVHDLSAKSDKRVNLKLLGEDTEIDKTVAELISDPLVHLVRNAIDHGIQKKPDRKMNEADGWIVLEARHEGGEVLVIVKDNGQGLDKDRILEKALESGIVKQADLPLSDKEINELIFHPGFSTCDDVTDFSGRGVGMDVVKQNLEKIKGRVDVFSRKGRGCSFVLRIPLTLAIIDGMLVRVGNSSYTIPLLSIRETLQISEHQVTTTMDGQEMVFVRDQMIPVIRLHDIYGMGRDDTDIDKGLVVVVEHQDDVAGLLIHDILGEQQAVIKGMSGYMDQVMGISGCTILGDGEVSLILDVGGLIQKAQIRGMARETTVH